jgi:hypothetical protein
MLVVMIFFFDVRMLLVVAERQHSAWHEESSRVFLLVQFSRFAKHLIHSSADSNEYRFVLRTGTVIIGYRITVQVSVTPFVSNLVTPFSALFLSCVSTTESYLAVLKN